MSRVGQIAEKESWRCRGDRQTAEKESWRCRGDRQTAKKDSWRCRGDRQIARARKAGSKTSRLKYRRRKAGGRSNFRIGMSAVHRRFREIKTPAMHIPVKMIKAIRITRIKIPGDASAREASPIQQVTMIVTITMLMV